MDFEKIFIRQLELHPSMQPQDIIKLCFQAAFGAEHMLSDRESARAYLEKELSEVPESDGALYEQISDEVCRINLSVWKAKNLPAEWLFRIFAASCEVHRNASELFCEYLQTAGKIIDCADVSFTMQEWKNYLNEYKKSGMPAVHHSEQYRTGEHPAYRIADIRFCRAFSVIEKAKEHLNGGKPCVIAIDGRAASGKTTLADTLKIILDADIVHTDDFFVPPELRSAERFCKPGENIHHERFSKEVLPYISKNEPFTYRIFDCGKADYNGVREIGKKHFRIVEGSYSCHPIFGSYADITVFSDISADEQINRIRNRNGEDMLKIFLERWIPMEEEYFLHYSIKQNTDIGIKKRKREFI